MYSTVSFLALIIVKLITVIFSRELLVTEVLHFSRKNILRKALEPPTL